MSRIARVPVTASSRTGFPATVAYVVGRHDAVLVDPAATAPDLDATVADRGVTDVVLTHAHPDHAGGVAAYADDATVWARAGYVDRFESVTGVAPDRTFHDGVVLPAGDGALTVVDLPGHAPDHVAFETADGATALVGDTVVAEGSVAVAAPDGDMRAYEVALRRLLGRRYARLLPGHGPVVDDPPAVCRRLLAHRRDRERRVLAAVETGAATPAAVVAAAYDKDVSAVQDLAERTVVAHLEKLAVEGRVEWDGERASLPR